MKLSQKIDMINFKLTEISDFGLTLDDVADMSNLLGMLTQEILEELDTRAKANNHQIS